MKGTLWGRETKEATETEWGWEGWLQEASKINTADERGTFSTLLICPVTSQPCMHTQQKHWEPMMNEVCTKPLGR